jgi:hypothetical protein
MKAIMKVQWAAFLLLVVLPACTTVVESNPSRTATEELLISQAADNAAANLMLQAPRGTKVFIDTSNFEGTDSKYAIASIRESLMKQGAYLVADKKDADTIVEIRSGALSTDKKTVLVGIPQFNIPVPFASSPVAFPEIALYGSEDQKGVAKFVMTGYDAKTGLLTATQDPQYGFAHRVKKTVLIFISWTESEALPTDDEAKLTHRSDNKAEWKF